MQKKIFFLGNFYFFTKKSRFFCGFLDFLRPAFGHGRLGHPQSLEYFAKKTPCLFASIVTLRIRVETDPGHDYGRKLAKVCQADLTNISVCETPYTNLYSYKLLKYTTSGNRNYRQYDEISSCSQHIQYKI